MKRIFILMLLFLNLIGCISKSKKIVLVGSYRKYLDEVCIIKAQLEKKGYEVLEPACGEVLNKNSEFIVMKGDIDNDIAVTEEAMKKIEEKFLNSIEKADIIYVINKNGYIGLSASMEIGFTKAIKKPVYCIEQPVDYGLKVIKICDKIISPEELTLYRLK